MLYPDLLWLILACLKDRIRQRARAAAAGNAEAGGLSVEWVFIVAGLVVAALAVGAFIIVKIHSEEATIP